MARPFHRFLLGRNLQTPQGLSRRQKPLSHQRLDQTARQPEMILPRTKAWPEMNLQKKVQKEMNRHQTETNRHWMDRSLGETSH